MTIYCMLHKCYIKDEIAKKKCLRRRSTKEKCKHMVFLKRPLKVG